MLRRNKALVACSLVGLLLTTGLTTSQGIPSATPSYTESVQIEPIKAVEFTNSDKAITKYDRAFYAIKTYLKSVEHSLTDEAIKDYSKWYVDFSDKYNVNLEDSLAMGWVESKFNKDLIGGSGEIGIMQILPNTGEYCGVTKKELYDPKTNIETGIRYLSHIKEHYELDRRMAIVAYNQGIGNVKRGTYKTWYYDKVNKNSQKMAELMESVTEGNLNVE